MAKYKLSDVAPIQQGSVQSSEKYWLLNLDMVESNTGRVLDYLYVSEDKIGSSTITFDTGNVLYSKLRPYLNKVVLPEQSGYATSEMLPMRPNQEIITREYLTYFLRSPRFVNYVNEKVTGAKMPRANIADLKAVEVECPPIAEQKRISALFDKTINLIGLRKEQLQQLEELVKLRFQEMFGNHDLNNVQEDWKPISAIGTVVGGATPKTSVAEYWDGEYRWITPAELDNEAGYIFDSVRKLTELGVRSCSLKEMPIGTVILSSRAPIGKVAIAGNTFYCNQGFKNIICNEEIHPMFLYTLLRMNTEYLISLGRGATFKEITKSIVENIRIPVPRKETQEKFATFVQKVDELKFVVQKSIDETQLLFDSLMQMYFS